MFKPTNLYTILLLLNGFFFLQQGFSQSGYSTTRSVTGPVWNNTTLAAHMNELTNRLRNWDGRPMTVSDIMGSMYYDDVFKMGKVFLGDQYYGSYLMRYNAYADELEAKKTEEHKPEAISKSTMLAFEIGTERYVLKSYVDEKKDLVDGYLSELVKGGKYNLYHKKRKRLKEGKKPETSFHEPVPPQFLDFNTYYIGIENNNPKQLKNSKKSLLSFVSTNHQSEVKKFLKQNGTNLRNVDDLVKVVEYMNSLE